MLRLRLIFALVLGLPAATAKARTHDDPTLCEGTALVTGTRAETRADGLARSLTDVLVKRSGDPALARDPRVDPFKAAAANLVTDYLYLDRMSDQPRHDEQGTRDRLYSLISRFDCQKIDAVLQKLGDRAWLAPRAPLLPRVVITDNRRASFPLTADGDPDERHREALLAAAMRFGMRIILPTLDQAGADMTIPDAVVVRGTLRWSDSDPGWAGAWYADGGEWGINGVSFDEAWRDLVLGAMAIASGHPPPRAAP
jgi:hypothetical protein